MKRIISNTLITLVTLGIVKLLFWLVGYEAGSMIMLSIITAQVFVLTLKQK